MSEPTGYLTQAQMTKVAETLTAAGWPVELVIEDALETPYEWDDTVHDYVCPKLVSITWGDWTISTDGDLNISWDHFPVNDCDLTAFIADVHKAWHAVGGATIRETERAA